MTNRILNYYLEYIPLERVVRSIDEDLFVSFFLLLDDIVDVSGGNVIHGFFPLKQLHVCSK